MNIERSQRGQALILLVAAIVGLVAITALAIDAGNAFSDRRHAQNAADAAALAGALTCALAGTPDCTSVSDQVRTIALTRADSNDYTNDGVNTVTVNTPPVAGCNGTNGAYVGNTEYIQVIIRSTVNTFFAPIVGINQLNNCVESIARVKPATTGEMFFGNAMVSLSPNTCRAFRVSGSSNTTVTGGGIFTNSNSGCQQGDFNQSGNGRITAPSNCVVGSSSFSSGKVIPPPSHCEPFPYPPQYILPEPSCAVDGTRTGSKKNGYNVTPGNIPGSWLSETVVLGSGVYCISGDATINSTDSITGQDVLLYFASGGLHINGKAEINLDAPDTGPYKGLLVYLPLDNDSSIIINGSSDSEFTGTILAPASDIQINGTAAAEGYHSQIIGYTIDLIGTSNAEINYSDEDNYDATIPPSIELAK